LPDGKYRFGEITVKILHKTVPPKSARNFLDGNAAAEAGNIHTLKGTPDAQNASRAMKGHLPEGALSLYPPLYR
jgi:hypothetical protein